MMNVPQDIAITVQFVVDILESFSTHDVGDTGRIKCRLNIGYWDMILI